MAWTVARNFFKRKAPPLAPSTGAAAPVVAAASLPVAKSPATLAPAPVHTPKASAIALPDAPSRAAAPGAASPPGSAGTAAAAPKLSSPPPRQADAASSAASSAATGKASGAENKLKKDGKASQNEKGKKEGKPNDGGQGPKAGKKLAKQKAKAGGKKGSKPEGNQPDITPHLELCHRPGRHPLHNSLTGVGVRGQLCGGSPAPKPSRSEFSGGDGWSAGLPACLLPRPVLG